MGFQCPGECREKGGRADPCAFRKLQRGGVGYVGNVEKAEFTEEHKEGEAELVPSLLFNEETLRRPAELRLLPGPDSTLQELGSIFQYSRIGRGA